METRASDICNRYISNRHGSVQLLEFQLTFAELKKVHIYAQSEVRGV